MDFSATAHDYDRHRAGFPDELFRRLIDLGVGWPGARVADVGCGTGHLALGWAARGCATVGVDVARPMLRAAAERATAQRIPAVFVEARAEATGLAGGAFDGVSAGQCWHWFDRPAAAREAARLLRPGGWIAVVHNDFSYQPGTVGAVSLETIRAHANPDAWTRLTFAVDGLYPQWPGDLAAAGFVDIETFSFDLSVLYTVDDWCGRIRASAAVGASLAPDAVEAFDGHHRRALTDRYAGGPLGVLHRVFAVVGRLG